MAILLIFKGLPGTGKTTLSLRLHEKLGWKLVIRDDIKEQLTQQNVPLNEIGKKSYEILWQELTDLLLNNQSVICDTNINHPSALPQLEKITNETKAKIVVIECYCGDENEHKKRLESRKDQSLSPFWIDSWEKFQSYLKSDDNKGDYEIPYQVIKVDTCLLEGKDDFIEHVVNQIGSDTLH